MKKEETAEKERKTTDGFILKVDAACGSECTGHRLQFQIEAADQGETVWNYLTRKKGFTKMQVKRMKFQPGGICIDQRQVRVTHVLAAGERLEVSLEASRRKKEKLQAESENETGMERPGDSRASISLKRKINSEAETGNKKSVGQEKRREPENSSVTMPDILYEDRDVLAVWKPHGIILHPSHGHHGDTLMDRMQERLAQRDGLEAADVPLYSIGRLDSDTSGIVVFARNQVAAQRLWQQRMDGRFQKQYLAKCEGHFPEKTDEEQCISQPIAPVPGELNRMRVDPAGKHAVTYCRIWREMENETWLLVHLGTGRTHQIRVHMAWMGYPLVGDSLYGNGKAGETCAALTACSAVFFQPFTGKRIMLNYLDKAERGE